MNISNKELQINDMITDKEVRLINTDGTQLGIVSIQKAKEIAATANLDLVKIAENANPPVCKIIDYGKYRFELAKKEKESKKNQKVIEVKEIRLSVNIDVHDFDTKVARAREFIEGKGYKVKVSLRFKGREVTHPEVGADVINRFADACSEFATLDKPPKLEGRSMTVFLLAKANVKPQSSKTDKNAESNKKGASSTVDSVNANLENKELPLAVDNVDTNLEHKELSSTIENINTENSDSV